MCCSSPVIQTVRILACVDFQQVVVEINKTIKNFHSVQKELWQGIVSFGCCPLSCTQAPTQLRICSWDLQTAQGGLRCGE